MKLRLIHSISSPTKITSLMITPNSVIIGGNTSDLHVYKFQETEGKETLEYYSIHLLAETSDARIISIPFFILF